MEKEAAGLWWANLCTPQAGKTLLDFHGGVERNKYLDKHCDLQFLAQWQPVVHSDLNIWPKDKEWFGKWEGPRITHERWQYIAEWVRRHRDMSDANNSYNKDAKDKRARVLESTRCMHLRKK